MRIIVRAHLILLEVMSANGVMSYDGGSERYNSQITEKTTAGVEPRNGTASRRRRPSRGTAPRLGRGRSSAFGVLAFNTSQAKRPSPPSVVLLRSAACRPVGRLAAVLFGQFRRRASADSASSPTGCWRRVRFPAARAPAACYRPFRPSLGSRPSESCGRTDTDKPKTNGKSSVFLCALF